MSPLTIILLGLIVGLIPTLIRFYTCPACVVVRYGSISCLVHGVRSGWNINGNISGETPLMSAIRRQRLDMVMFLLHSGAGVLTKNGEPNGAIEVLAQLQPMDDSPKALEMLRWFQRSVLIDMIELGVPENHSLVQALVPP